MQTVGEECSVAAAVEFSRVASLSWDIDTKAMETSNYLEHGASRFDLK